MGNYKPNGNPLAGVLRKLRKSADSDKKWEYGIRCDKAYLTGWENELTPFSESLIPYKKLIIEAYQSNPEFRNVRLVRREVGEWEDV